MKRNKMGNLLSIAGDDAEDIKRFIDSFLSQDSESDDPEEIIVGGYDEEDNKDPELITFIYKSGFKDSLTAHDFRSPRKSYAARKESYHSSEYEGEDAYQNGGDDTRRDSGSIGTEIKFCLRLAQRICARRFSVFGISTYYCNLFALHIAGIKTTYIKIPVKIMSVTRISIDKPVTEW